MMGKKTIILFSLLACISVILNSIDVYITLDKNYQLKDNEGTKNIIAKQAKAIVDKIDNYAKNLPNSLNYKEKINLIKKEINTINFDNYQEKAYAFNELGFYIAHYSKDYEHQNIFLEKDTNNKFYIKELLAKIKDEGYTKANIFWTNYSIRHIITYIKKDKNLNVYYGCTIDLDKIKNFKKIKASYNDKEKILIIFSTLFIIFTIICFTLIQYKKTRKKQ
ncbi:MULTISPECIES: hypothetical protein [unclassified Campylobacter]|uniref:hypothetical protein n=4 Tax=Campylobacter TaxID=194 RepID=UPI001BD9297A|nr:hypothetical protein [Campylobacter sp. 2018MI10]MBT0884349.1 hypothetical protein [Campylobacter sp. 2018MI10]MBZ7977403.1 hypothetical protein [Campylobacter sp. RM12654]MBZ7983244.1 hypothetical protein [Campylobacter sp. RM12647]MBZ7992511.1 hypothetical protein [Campylobacter sp. RM9333]